MLEVPRSSGASQKDNRWKGSQSKSPLPARMVFEKTRSVYEQVLERKFGSKGQYKGTSMAVSHQHKHMIFVSPDITGNQPNITSTEPRSTSGTFNSNKGANSALRNGSIATGCLSVEQLGMMQRVFDFYSSPVEHGTASVLRFNKFRKLLHESKVPLEQTVIELIYYGENKHR